MELIAREINFSIPTEAVIIHHGGINPVQSSSLRVELERSPPSLKLASSHQHQRKLLDDSGLNLSTQPSNHSTATGIDLPSAFNKRKRDFFPHGMDEDFCS
ncbi:hypothetical protein IEQ34_026960 [Dendrobium chrysotoxum]|uniref:Uncharacterized protein n=1 Tax=Dendrobium chrysotoxum TaxID=161865 RepID=A0AAV7FI69_DENCH|nr:hypothetical protein IEQ34_026960 [Dendrobium chrysotoxum]